MLIYVSHRYGGDKSNIERARQITHDLQVNDLENTYICPLLTLSSLEYSEIPFDDEMELCLDLLTVCERMIVASDISKSVSKEISFANLVNMEVIYLENTRNI